MQSWIMLIVISFNPTTEPWCWTDVIWRSWTLVKLDWVIAVEILQQEVQKLSANDAEFMFQREYLNDLNITVVSPELVEFSWFQLKQIGKLMLINGTLQASRWQTLSRAHWIVCSIILGNDFNVQYGTSCSGGSRCDEYDSVRWGKTTCTWPDVVEAKLVVLTIKPLAAKVPDSNMGRWLVTQRSSTNRRAATLSCLSISQLHFHTIQTNAFTMTFCEVKNSSV